MFGVAPSQRKTIVLCLSFFLFVVFLSSLYRSRSHHSQPQPQSQPEPHSPNFSFPSWTYDPARDQENYGLSDEKCEAAFPGLYREIDRAVEFRRKVGNVTLDDIDTSWRGAEIARVLIYNRQIYIIEARWNGGGYDSSRAAAILHAIHRAMLAYDGPIPNVEFTFCTGDVSGGDEMNPNRPLWALTRHVDEEAKWVMSDFGYWSWSLKVIGSYEQVRSEIRDIEEETPYELKEPKAVWRGAFGPNHLREVLAEKAAGKKWSEVREILWAGRTEVAEESQKLTLTMPEHCNYQFVVHTEGVSYSGRGKYLLNCHSISIIHKPEWVEPHQHLMVKSGPEQNIVEVERDWEDLDGKITHLLDHPEEAKRIADNSIATFRDRYLSPAAQACYWRRMLKGWATVQAFEPQLYETTKVVDLATGKEVLKRKRRGKTFEFYVSE